MAWFSHEARQRRIRYIDQDKKSDGTVLPVYP